MPFTEKLKLAVKHKAAFRCCRCHEVGVDIHHIVPQTSGGSDEEDNAAPLCQNCHDRFGGNPEKRKEIRQMRDWWYDVAKEKFGGDLENTGRINELLVQLQENNAAKLDEVKTELLSQIEQLRSANKQTIESADTPAAVSRAANSMISATKLGNNVYANVSCKKCGTMIGMMVGGNACPTCGNPIG
jgi:hypothetical protein